MVFGLPGDKAQPTCDSIGNVPRYGEQRIAWTRQTGKKIMYGDQTCAHPLSRPV